MYINEGRIMNDFIVPNKNNILFLFINGIMNGQKSNVKNCFKTLF